MSSQSQEYVNSLVYNSAIKNNGTLHTDAVPQTNHGKLACAWAVNEVVREALGQTISADKLSTIAIFEALSRQGKGIRIGDLNLIKPGAIIIAPTQGNTHGHVGIVGENGRVYSNDSSLKLFCQNYTIVRWTARYDHDLKLKTTFFDLNPEKFTPYRDLQPNIPGLNVIVDLWGGDAPTADFQAVKNSGIAGVIHKATDPLHGEDGRYESHRQSALEAKLLWGSYHFGRNGKVQGVQEQVNQYLNKIAPGGKDLSTRLKDELICLDFEIDESHPDTAMTVKEAEAFVQAIYEKVSRYPVLYAGAYLREQSLSNDSVLKKCPLWFADYRRRPAPQIPSQWSKWTMWQWAGDVHTVNGLTQCDRSTFNGTIDEYERFWNGKDQS